MTDDEQIRQLQAHWVQLREDGDLAGWSALYTEEGRYVRPNGEASVGRAAIGQHIEQSEARNPPGRKIAHIWGPSVIRVDGDRAESATDFVAFARDGVDSPWRIVTVGRFQNRFVRQAGR